MVVVCFSTIFPASAPVAAAALRRAALTGEEHAVARPVDLEKNKMENQKKKKRKINEI